MTPAENIRNEQHMTAAEFGIALRASVTSADGKRLGSVNDMRGPFFKMHRNFLTGDCWLDVGNVVAAFDDEVVVDFEKRAVGAYQVPDDIATDERLDARADHLLDDRQLVEQRERMERELERRR